MTTIRQRHLERLDREEFDVAIIGSGINGSVTAAALAAAGARVALIDKGDFASNASSNSSNLIWGGIKYLESHEYALVNKLCQCRNRLMRARPSSVREVRFLTTIEKGFRFPALVMYCGTLLYWLIGRFFTQAPTYLSRQKIGQRESAVNVARARAGFEYSDCYLVDGDARLVLRFVQTCRKAGGAVANYVESVTASRTQQGWTIEANDLLDGQRLTIRSRALVNACGPEVDQYNTVTKQRTDNRHLFSKGAHLIVRRLTRETRVLAFFAYDGRLFFVLPMGSRSCIGTTDTRIDQPHAEVSAEDREFILSNANEMLDLAEPLTEADIISERCGVRPLAVESGEGSTDWLQLSRKHAIEADQQAAHVSIFGGKLTDCLNVGEEVVEIMRGIDHSLAPKQPTPGWYAEPIGTDKTAFFDYAELVALNSFTVTGANESLADRLWRRYELDARQIAGAIVAEPGKADVLFAGSDYCWAELDYAADHEMISTLNDLFRRRSDIAMVIPRTEIEQSPLLPKISEVLFADLASQKLSEFLIRPTPVEVAVKATA